MSESRSTAVDYCNQDGQALERLRTDCGVDHPYVPDLFGPLFATDLVEACATAAVILTTSETNTVTHHREDIAFSRFAHNGCLRVNDVLHNVNVDEYIAFTLAGYGIQRDRRADLWNVLQLAIVLKREATMIECTRLLRENPERTEYSSDLSFHGGTSIHGSTEAPDPDE